MSGASFAYDANGDMTTGLGGKAMTRVDQNCLTGDEAPGNPKFGDGRPRLDTGFQDRPCFEVARRRKGGR